MNNIDIIQNSIDYIEQNLKAELSAEEIARKAGFSLFHYYRIFQSIVGMPVIQYVLRRKMINAIYEISCGGKIIDVALCYGFDTYAGFFKAFKREYDCSPSKYLKKYTVKIPYKINLIQEEHIMITHKRIKEILSNWDIKDEKISDFCYDGSGIKSENTWYIGDNFVIKVGTNLTGLKNHIEISKALSVAGLEVAIPVATKAGNDYVLDGDTYFCITNRLQGDCIKSYECYEGDYPSKSRYIGEIIGKLHLVLQEHDKGFICNEPNLFESIKDWAMPEVKRVMGLPNSFYDEYLYTFGGLYPKLPKHIIHRDLNPSNIIIQDGRLTGFIDFELSERNIRIFDPCYASTAIMSESFVENDIDKLNKWLVIFKNILIGYDSICKLSKDEKEAIPYVVFSIQMSCVAFFGNKDKFAKLATINQKMLKWLYENRENLKF